MREIKFKCWDNNLKKMIVQDRTDRVDKCPIYYETHIKTILIQFTGLFDKNGVEIYKGDIVKAENGKIFKVVFDDGNYVVARPQKRLKIVCNLGVMARNEDIEVVGNIFENKELLC